MKKIITEFMTLDEKERGSAAVGKLVLFSDMQRQGGHADIEF